MGNHAHMRPFNTLRLNEVPKEWLWVEGRRQSPRLRRRAVQRSVKETEKECSQ